MRELNESVLKTDTYGLTTRVMVSEIRHGLSRQSLFSLEHHVQRNPRRPTLADTRNRHLKERSAETSLDQIRTPQSP